MGPEMLAKYEMAVTNIPKLFSGCSGDCSGECD